MMSRKFELKFEFIRKYLDDLMQADIDTFGLPASDDYHFMQRYLSLALSLDENVRSDYLPEPIEFVVAYALPKHFIVDTFLIKNKDKFFELFYYYKGLGTL